MAMIQELHRQGKTIVLITHEREIAEYADRIVLIRDGILYEEGENADDTDDTNHKRNSQAMQEHKIITAVMLFACMILQFILFDVTGELNRASQYERDYASLWQMRKRVLRSNRMMQRYGNGCRVLR